MGVGEEGQELITSCIHYIFLEVSRVRMPAYSPSIAAYHRILQSSAKVTHVFVFKHKVIRGE